MLISACHVVTSGLTPILISFLIFSNKVLLSVFWSLIWADRQFRFRQADFSPELISCRSRHPGGRRRWRDAVCCLHGHNYIMADNQSGTLLQIGSTGGSSFLCCSLGLTAEYLNDVCGFHLQRHGVLVFSSVEFLQIIAKSPRETSEF